MQSACAVLWPVASLAAPVLYTAPFSGKESYWTWNVCFFSLQLLSETFLILRRISVERTNKMQPCNRIYYSTVHWGLNMFRAAYRSSSGALTVLAASGLHKHVVTGRSHVWWWAVCRSKHVEPSMNGGIINSITRLHLAGSFYWFILRCTDPWVSNEILSVYGACVKYPLFVSDFSDTWIF